MNNKKIIGILIIVIGAIALVGVVYFMFFYNFSPKTVFEDSMGEQPNKPPAQVINKIKDSPQKAIINTEKQIKADIVSENDLKQMAASFAERFGSYSNQSNFGNIRDLKIFMSINMKRWADDYIQKEISNNINSSIYVGMTTKAVSGKVTQFDDDAGIAEILISTQRRMATGTTNNIVNFQQDVIINFIKEQGVWRVDSAEWGDVL